MGSVNAQTDRNGYVRMRRNKERKRNDQMMDGRANKGQKEGSETKKVSTNMVSELSTLSLVGPPVIWHRLCHAISSRVRNDDSVKGVGIKLPDEFCNVAGRWK
jgi:hypothetical protein